MPDSPSPPSLDEMVDALQERIAHLEIVRGRGPITKRLHELICMRAVLAQLEASRWRDIAEAPKDGTRIVLYDGDVPAVGLWREADQQWIVDWDHEPYAPPVTHFMPLPSSPTTASEGGK